MPTFNNRVLVLAAGALLATAACGGNTQVPYTSQVAAPGASSIVPNDKTSILKRLTKDVEIGSTVDRKNGDMGPRAISTVRSTFGLLKTGQLLVCNFDDAAGTAGKGTTIELFDPHPRSKPVEFAQSANIEGCDGDAVSGTTNNVYGAGQVSGRVAQFDPTGKLKKKFGPPFEAPFDDVDAFCGLPYLPEDIYISDAKTGSIVKVTFVPVSRTGRETVTQVITGFGVNNGAGWSVLGPSGMQYDNHRIRNGHLCNDTLYMVDGVDNTVVAVSNASNLTREGRDRRASRWQEIHVRSPNVHVREARLQWFPTRCARCRCSSTEREPHHCEHQRRRRRVGGVDADRKDTRHEKNRHEQDRSRLRARRDRNERWRYGPVLYR